MLFEFAGTYYAIGYPESRTSVKRLIKMKALPDIGGWVGSEKFVMEIRADDIERIFRDKLAPAMVKALIGLAFPEATPEIVYDENE